MTTFLHPLLKVPLYNGKQLTYPEFLNLKDDGFQYEMIEGALHVTPAPLGKHQDMLGYLFLELGLFLRKHPIGKLYLAPRDVKLSDTLVYQPDLLFISTERFSIITEQYIDGVPDFIIEILSSSTQKTDTQDKFKNYEKYGVQEYWIMNPQDIKSSQFYILEAGQYQPLQYQHNRIHSKAIPGFLLNLKQLKQALL